MPSLMYLALANAACAGVLALAAVAAGRWLRRPALTHCLWLLVLIKLVTPPLFPLSLEWLPAAPPPAATTNDDVAMAPAVVDIVTGPDVAGPPTADDVWLEMEKAKAKGKKPVIQQLLAARAKAQEQADAVSQAELTPPTPAPALTARPESRLSLRERTPTVADTIQFVLTILGGVWLIGSALSVRSARCGAWRVSSACWAMHDQRQTGYKPWPCGWHQFGLRRLSRRVAVAGAIAADDLGGAGPRSRAAAGGFGGATR